MIIDCRIFSNMTLFYAGYVPLQAFDDSLQGSTGTVTQCATLLHTHLAILHTVHSPPCTLHTLCRTLVTQWHCWIYCIQTQCTTLLHTHLVILHIVHSPPCTLHTLYTG